MGNKRNAVRIGRPLLGDAVESALSAVGITSERVSSWFGGRNCGCEERKQFLNRLDAWARRTLGWTKEDAEKDLIESVEQHDVPRK